MAEQRRFQGSGAALAGLLFAILFTVGFILLDHKPEPDATSAELVEYYRGSGGTALIIAGFYLVPFAGISFIWFLAASRHRLSEMTQREDALLATVQLCAGVIFVAMIWVAAAAAVAGVAAVRSGTTEPDILSQARTMATYGEALLMIYAFRVVAVFIIASTTRAFRAGLFPRWFAWFGYLTAAALLLVLTYARAIVLLIPLWVAGASIIVLFRRVHSRKAIA